MTQKSRTIHPDDAQDERLAGLPLSAAYTYAYLPTVLDDEGRAKDLPAVLNGYLWPLRADEHATDAMAADLSALVDAGLLCRYQADGAAYLHDPRWKVRQKIARPVPSVLPRCATHDRTFDETIAETVGKVSEQVNAFLGGAGPRMDEARVRDSIVRIVEDVTFMVDPQRAASYGQKVRGMFAKGAEPARPLRVVDPLVDPPVDTDEADDSASREPADKPPTSPPTSPPTAGPPTTPATPARRAATCGRARPTDRPSADEVSRVRRGPTPAR
jgi:hypothetical protein